jgi:hypothetical protein
MKNTVKTLQDGSQILLRDGMPMICPFRSSHLIPGKFNSNEIELQRMPCDSHCPHWSRDKGTAAEVLLSCSGSIKIIKLEQDLKIV